jgi:hypothetical protein
MLAFAEPGMDGAQQGCNLPGPYGGVSCGARVGFAPRALLAANSGFYILVHLLQGRQPTQDSATAIAR